MHNLIKNTKTIRLPLDTTTTYVGTAGTTDLTTEGVDTLGYENVVFKVAFGAITSGAVTSVKLQQSSDDAATDAYSDIAGSAQTVADDDDNQIVMIEVHRPLKRYLCAVVDRGTQNAVVDYMEAILFNGAQVPITADTLVCSQEVLISPAEGSA
jgi:hypothetical protein